LNNSGRVSNQWIHNTDWLPTLAAAAKLEIKGIKLDGISHWDSLMYGLPGNRNEIVNAIDDLSGYNSLMKDGWKLVDERLMKITDNTSAISIENGSRWSGEIDGTDINLSPEEYFLKIKESEVGKLVSPPIMDNVLKLREEATVKCLESPVATKCDSLAAPCLFNIITDPCEFNNLATEMPMKVQELIQAVNKYREGSEPLRNQPEDPQCDPKYHNFTWTWWRDSETEFAGPEDLYKMNVLADIIDGNCVASSFWSQAITMDILFAVVGGMLLIIVVVFIFLRRK
jgi:arylsulfatase B